MTSMASSTSRPTSTTRTSSGKGKEMQDRLSRLVAIFEGLDFRANRAEGDDLLGDAYEYLMRHFATESGKSKGQFYTPAEVSRIMAKVVGVDRSNMLKEPTIYDPTCGSGSLLAEGRRRGLARAISPIYGQEMDNATWAPGPHEHDPARLPDGRHLARATRWPPRTSRTADGLQDVRLRRRQSAVLLQGLVQRAEPGQRRIPPLRVRHPAGEERRLRLPAARAQVPEEHRQGGDHSAPRRACSGATRRPTSAATSSSGARSRASSACPPICSSARASRPASWCIDKENAHARTGIFMIDASKGFIKDGNKNRLRAQDIHKIVDVFNRQIDRAAYSRMVPVAEIGSPANDYNLNIPRYIDSSEPEDLQDLDAHLTAASPTATSTPWTVIGPSSRRSARRCS